SSRYVPAFRFDQVNDWGVPTATSLANDCTRSGCGGGLFTAAPVFAMGQVTSSVAWFGLFTCVPPVPRPPPTWPTRTVEVGTLLVPVQAGKERLLVKLIVRPLLTAWGGTVITTGDHPVPAFGFSAAHVAKEFCTIAPHV